MSDEYYANMPVYLEGRLARCIVERCTGYEIGEGRPGKVIYDFSKCGFIDPTGLILVTFLIGQTLEAGIRAEYVPPRKDILNRYLKSIGFQSFFRLREDGIKALDVKNGCLRLKMLNCDDAVFVNEVVEFLLSRVELSEGARNWVYDGFSELIGNAFQHSTSKYVLACGQAYRDTNQIRICVGDAGIGIPTHLRQNPLYQNISSSSEALKKALEEGVTGTLPQPFPKNSGVGLTTLRKIAIGSGGMLRIISLDAMLETRSLNEPRTTQFNRKYGGTIVGITIGVRAGYKLVIKTNNGKYF